VKRAEGEPNPWETIIATLQYEPTSLRVQREVSKSFPFFREESDGRYVIIFELFPYIRRPLVSRFLPILSTVLAAILAAVPALTMVSAQPKKKGTNYAFLVACAGYDKAELRPIKDDVTIKATGRQRFTHILVFR
jgi:hypothetical protein